MIFDAPVAHFLCYFERHLVEFDGELALPEVFVLDCDVVVGEHGHVPYLSLIFLRYGGSEALLVPVQVVETGLDGLDGFLVEFEVREDDTLVDVGGGDGFVGFLKVFIE